MKKSLIEKHYHLSFGPCWVSLLKSCRDCSDWQSCIYAISVTHVIKSSEVSQVHAPQIWVECCSVSLALVLRCKVLTSTSTAKVWLWEMLGLDVEEGYCAVVAKKPMLAPSVLGGTAVTRGDLACFRLGVRLHPSLLTGAPLETADMFNCWVKDWGWCELRERFLEAKLDWQTFLAKATKALSLCLSGLEIEKSSSASSSSDWLGSSSKVGRWVTVVGPLRKLFRFSAVEGSSKSMFVLWERWFILFLLFRMSWFSICLPASPWMDPFNPLSPTCSDLWMLWYCAGCAVLPWKRRSRKAVSQEIKHTDWQSKHTRYYYESWEQINGWRKKTDCEKLANCILL